MFTVFIGNKEGKWVADSYPATDEAINYVLENIVNHAFSWYCRPDTEEAYELLDTYHLI